jgi:very-short-patch-repair endonuclease
LLNSGISDDEIFFGYNDKREWYIWAELKNKIFFYDFCIRSKKIIIEFQGSKFHFNKEKHNDSWRSLYSNQTPEESMLYDNSKKILAEQNGFILLYVWDTDDVDEFLNNLKNIYELHAKRFIRFYSF